ncbi:hypothetical protein JOJ88_004944 [Pantoea cypripedii]|nr:hypothetical protein [Pantoea cypripedii]
MLRRVVTYFVAAITLANVLFGASHKQSLNTNRFAYLANSPCAVYG